MPSLLAHQPGPVSHTGVTFSEKFAQLGMKNITKIQHCPKRVATAPFGAFPAPSGPHGPQDASGMPPGA